MDTIITNLIDTIIDDCRDACWTDSEIVEKLIRCGLTKEHLIKYGFESLAYTYSDHFHEDNSEYIEDWPSEFDFKSNVNLNNLIYHAKEVPQGYVVTCYGHNCEWTFDKIEMYKSLSEGDYTIIESENK